LKHNLKNSAGVIGLKILSGLSTFLLYIAFSHYLPPEKLGVYELSVTMIMLLSTFFSLGYVPFASGEFTRKELAEVGFSTNKINTAYIFSVLLISLVLVPALFFFSSMMKFSASQWVIILVASSLFFYKAMYSGVLQHTFRPLKYSFFEACYPTTVSLISIGYLFLFDAHKVEVLLASHVIVLFFIASAYGKEKQPAIKLFTQLDLSEYVGIVRVSYPWFIVALMSWVMYSSDKWVLEYSYTTKLVGLYSQIFKLSSAYNLIIISTIAIVYSPYIYKSFKSEAKQTTWNMINKQAAYLCLLTSALLVLDLFIGELIYKILIGEQYHDAFQYNYLIIVNFMLTAIIGYYGYVYVYYNRTKNMQIVLGFGMLLNLLISILITPIFGIYGVIYASLIAQLSMLFYTRIQSKKMLFS